MPREYEYHYHSISMTLVGRSDKMDWARLSFEYSLHTTRMWLALSAVDSFIYFSRARLDLLASTEYLSTPSEQNKVGGLRPIDHRAGTHVDMESNSALQ